MKTSQGDPRLKPWEELRIRKVNPLIILFDFLLLMIYISVMRRIYSFYLSVPDGFLDFLKTCTDIYSHHVEWAFENKSTNNAAKNIKTNYFLSLAEKNNEQAVVNQPNAAKTNVLSGKPTTLVVGY
jgi:hypothetical protein